ncbi:hypothetical protein C5B96_03255 [Subtercola sp. Z020]|uniref:hypothetical protein n=1 Tax=Subtercola sp. Z020 TaxID=2080582 RepID=UPI000CE84DC8|nr:hypothetical protein [Subtercola sp. Z020]PPF87885.1 hypothetical protein C5B96_03255 [Subtercola sp. Z020]
MAREPDDDALSWGDENDPTYVAAHPAALDEDDLEEDVPVVEVFSSSAVAPPLPVPPSAEADAARAPEPAQAAAATSGAPVAAGVDTAADRDRDHDHDRDTVAERDADRDLAAADRDLADAEAETAPLSSAGLIAFGVFGGIFLLYTVGWLVTYIRNPTDPSGLAGIVQNAQNVLAIAAPALWFIVTLLLGARRRVPVRITWLAIGVVVLLPWPFLTGY